MGLLKSSMNIFALEFKKTLCLDKSIGIINYPHSSEAIRFKNSDLYLATFKAKLKGKPLPANCKEKCSTDY